MKVNKNVTIGGAFAVALLTGTLLAQQEKIADQDLLSLLATVDQEAVAFENEPELPVVEVVEAEPVVEVVEVEPVVEVVEAEPVVEVVEVEPVVEVVEAEPVVEVVEAEPVVEVVEEKPKKAKKKKTWKEKQAAKKRQAEKASRAQKETEEVLTLSEAMASLNIEESVVEEQAVEAVEAVEEEPTLADAMASLNIEKSVVEKPEVAAVEEEPTLADAMASLNIQESVAEDSEVVAIEDAPSLAETMSALEIQSPVEEVPSLAETMSALNVDEPVVPAENFETVAAELVMDAPVEDPTAAFVDEVGLNPADDRGELTTENLISVRLDKVSLEDAINLFAQLSGANIIVPELAEAAPISVNLKDVEWRPALQSILDTYNYELYQRVSGSNVYSVRRRAADAPEPQVVETFLLKYATVPNVAALVRELLPEDAKISEFASRNMLVVKSSESSLSEVRAVLETIDKVRQQVYIESKFMELNDDAVKMLGINWALLQTDEQGNHKGYQAGLGDLKKTKSRGETYSRSGGRYYDATGSEFAFGPQDALSEGQLSNPNGPGIDIWNGLTPSISSVTGLDKSEVITSVLDADDFRVMLSALEDNADINIVSNPKIIVANEESANISIVRKEPNLKQERQQTAGAAAGGAIDNTTFELDPDRPFFEYGVTLDVVPSINTTSNITMKIKPAITRFVRDKPAGEVTYPIYDEKSVETVFSLASGQTAAIGGLTEVSEGEEEKKVPLLGDIPYLGRLFSWKRTTQGIQETVIFVTVGLANTHQITEETGMPSDAELARRRVISDNNNKQLRARSRSYFIAGEGDRVEDARKIMDRVEEQRVEQRRLALERAQEKAEKASK